jgi:hypothetical protein
LRETAVDVMWTTTQLIARPLTASQPDGKDLSGSRDKYPPRATSP